MFDQLAFEKCVRANLKDRSFGKKRSDTIIKEFRQRQTNYTEDGKSADQAAPLALDDLMGSMAREHREKLKRTAKTLSVQAANMSRVEQGAKIEIGEKSSRGKAIADAAISTIISDPRYRGSSYFSGMDVIRGELYAIAEDLVEKTGKGVLATQRGKAHIPNIADEIMGTDTADPAAKAIAEGWKRANEHAVDLFNAAGGSMNKLDNFLPDPTNSMVKLNGAHLKGVKKGKDVEAVLDGLVRSEAFRKYEAIALEHWDWARMRHPDGSRITPEDRGDVIDFVYRTKASGGANKIDPKKLRGQGRAIGNMIDQHRFVHFKDATGWKATFEEFGDGNVMELMVRHLDDLSHKIALVEAFGPNPEMAVNNMRDIVTAEASKVNPKAAAEADARMSKKFDPMMRTILRSNPMDPESLWGLLVTGAANIITPAFLGRAVLTAVPGDLATSYAARAAHKLPQNGSLKFYGQNLTNVKESRRIAVRTGLISDDYIHGTYAATRWTGFHTMGPAVTRMLPEWVMRSTGMNLHTTGARLAIRQELMATLWDYKGKKFDDLDFKALLERFDIKEAEWDAVRNNAKAFKDRGVEFLRPIDLMNTNLPNKVELFRKFQEMSIVLGDEAVPSARLDAKVALSGDTRPDTLHGALAYSFGMFKNFPISYAIIFGRLGMMSPTVKGRATFYAGLVAGMTAMGALSLQMSEVAKGKDFAPMDDPKFWGKATLKGGGFGIMGDFLTAGVNRFGQGPAEMVAGPVVGAGGDLTQLALGDLFTLMQEGKLDEPRTAALAVQTAKRYNPTSTMWWSGLAFERILWDRLEEIADPKVYKKRRRRLRKQLKETGQEFWWEPGQRVPDRPPEYQGRP